MKILSRFAAVVASVLVLSVTSTTYAQSTNIAVIDVARVFKESIRFKQAMDVMKKDVETYEGVVRRKQEAIQNDAKEAQLHEVGTPDYKRIEERAAKAASDLQVEMGLKRKELMEREARLYYNTYVEVTKIVAKFAEQHGVRLVLRFNGEEIKPNDRNSVLQGVNNNIVYQKDLNITDIVIAEINRGAVTPTADERGRNQSFTPPTFGPRP